MALSSGNVDDIFEVLGKFLRLDELSSALRSDMLTYKTALEGVLDDNLATEYADVYSELESIDYGLGSMEDYSKSWIDRILTSYPVIRNNLNLSGVVSSQEVVQYLLRELIALSESVEANSVSIGSITYDLNTSGAFSILTDLTLDGVTAPAAWMQSSIYHNGLTSQIAIDEDLEFVANSVNPRSLTVRGKGDQNLNSSRFPALSAGNGAVNFAHANTLVPDFDEFTGDTPQGWTNFAGDDGVTAETTDTHGAASALKFLGTGAVASYERRIDLSASIVPLKRYCVVCFVKGNASLTSGDLTITTGGTGYSSPTGIVLNQAALAAQTSYGIESFFFTAPADEIDDFYLSVKFDDTPSAHAIYVAKLYVVPVEYFNGVGFVPVQGNADVVQGDAAIVPVENDYASDWNTRLPRKIGVQLPSSGSPTILDTLIA